jgi:hypothetical protein
MILTTNKNADNIKIDLSNVKQNCAIYTDEVAMKIDNDTISKLKDFKKEIKIELE